MSYNVAEYVLLDGLFVAYKIVKKDGFISSHLSLVHQRGIRRRTDTHTRAHTHTQTDDSNRRDWLRIQRLHFV